jgi:predicted metal-dependent HD superfamily phosphohydrolase
VTGPAPRPEDTSARWQPLIAALGREPSFLTELIERYAEPHRRYHGVAHIDALAGLFEEVAAGPGWRQPAEVALAILFHDAVYQPGRADNEARSAQLARERLIDWGQVDRERVAALIEATAAHGLAQTEGDLDFGHFLDADIAILGAPPDVYDRYARGVFEEYAPVVDEPAFRTGRRSFVQSQLAQAQLFHTLWFKDHYEAIARENLARELAELS